MKSGDKKAKRNGGRLEEMPLVILICGLQIRRQLGDSFGDHWLTLNL